MSLAYLTAAAATLLKLAIPMLLGATVDQILSSGDQGRLFFFAGSILLVSILGGAVSYGQTFLSEAVSQRAAFDLRNDIFKTLHRMSFDFYDRYQTGNLMSRATGDVDAVRDFTSRGVLTVTTIVFTFGTVSYFMLATDLRLGLITLSVVPLVTGFAITMRRRMTDLWVKVHAETADMTTILQENLSGQKVVKAFGAEEFEEKRFLNRTGEVAEHAYEAAALQANNAGMMTFFYMASTALILWVGGTEVVDGNMTAGELAQFILYLGMLAMPVRIAAWVTNSFSRGLSAGTRIFEILDSDPSIFNHDNADSTTKIKGEIKFENVSFYHESGKDILHNIDFRIKPGETLGIIGPPGSGKTSIINLIPRFYEPTDGFVTIDNISVDKFELINLRKIAYGNPNISIEEIEKVAKIAQIHEFVMSLPHKYDTVVGERGSTLSGGQRQRISIARALLIDPPILIIDDATSSVDTITEKYIQAQLENISQDKTTIIIAHRISSVQNADNIIV